jgi:hypothetical protein
MTSKPRLTLVGLAITTLLLSGCATGATATRMTIEPSEVTGHAPPELAKSVVVEAVVVGGQETNPRIVSRIDNEAFKTALTESLRRAGLLSDNEHARYHLQAIIESLEQPVLAVEMTVVAKVRYTLIDARTGKIVYRDLAMTTYTAAFHEAYLGAKRLRLANEGAARKNIAQLIGNLNALELQPSQIAPM